MSLCSCKKDLMSSFFIIHLFHELVEDYISLLKIEKTRLSVNEETANTITKVYVLKIWEERIIPLCF